MCPLRLILIFLSATLAGFFVLKNLKSQPQPQIHEGDPPPSDSVNPPPSDSSLDQNKSSSKVWGAMSTGFWTCVDMASGRYLWRNLVSSSSSSKGSS